MLLLRILVALIVVDLGLTEAILQGVYYVDDWEQIYGHVEDQAHRVCHLDHHFESAIVKIK